MFRDFLSSGDHEDSDGLFGNLIAEEGPFDGNTLWRLGSWGGAAIAALTIAILLNQSSFSLRRQAFASTADLARETERIQWVSDNSQAESRRLTAATQTLQNDRDRLYERVTSLEQSQAAMQNLASAAPVATVAEKLFPKPDSGAADAALSNTSDKPQEKALDKAPDKALAQNAASVAESIPAAPITFQQTQIADSSAPPVVSQRKLQPVAEPASPPADAIVTGSIGKGASSSTNTAPAQSSANQPVADKASVIASPVVMASTDAATATVEQTKFGVDLGDASSIPALRVLWATMQKSNGGLLGSLRPIMVMKEGGNGLGLQLHLVAGPMSDAAAATQLCVTLAVRNYTCDTAVFDGQSLPMDNVQAETEHPAPPSPVVVAKRKKEVRRRVVTAPLPPVQQQPAPAPSALARLMGAR